MEGQTFLRKLKNSHELCQKLKETTKTCVFSKTKHIQENQKTKLWESMDEKERKEKFQAEKRSF